MIIPTLTKLAESADYVAWIAKFPPGPPRHGSTLYRVTTYPGSDEIVVTSYVRNTRVVNTRRLEQIRAGLSRFEQIQAGLKYAA